MIVMMKGANQIFLQSPHCTANSPKHVYSSGQDAIVCKSCATQLGVYHVPHVMCYVVQTDSSVVIFDRLKLYSF